MYLLQYNHLQSNCNIVLSYLTKKIIILKYKLITISNKYIFL